MFYVGLTRSRIGLATLKGVIVFGGSGIGVTPTGSVGPFKTDSPLKPVIIEKVELLDATTPAQTGKPELARPASGESVLSPK